MTEIDLLWIILFCIIGEVVGKLAGDLFYIYLIRTKKTWRFRRWLFNLRDDSFAPLEYKHIEKLWEKLDD